MRKVYGKYFGGALVGDPCVLAGHDLMKEDGELICSAVEVLGIRPDNIFTNGASGIADELGLHLYRLANCEILVGSIEFRLGHYLFYSFSPEDQEYILNNRISVEEYLKRHSFEEYLKKHPISKKKA